MRGLSFSSRQKASAFLDPDRDEAQITGGRDQQQNRAAALFLFRFHLFHHIGRRFHFFLRHFDDHIAGADAFLQVAPYYNKPSQEGVFQHLKKIAESTGKPIMLYSIPGRCGIDIAVDTVKRLAEECPNIRTIKEAGGDAGRVRALLQACPELTVLSGDDGLIPAFVEAGAKGVVSVASNFAPEIIKTITTACLEGNTKESADLVEKWKPLLTDLVFMDGNPVTIKEVMYQAGRLPSPRVRLPLVRTGTENQTRIRELLQSINLLSA